MDKIKFAKTKPNAKLPSYGRDGDGCMDIYACYNDNEFPIVVPPHTNKLIATGICSSFPPNYRISVRERGSNTKSGLQVMAGQVDSNYRGEYFVALYNSNDQDVYIMPDVTEVAKIDNYIMVPYSKAIAQIAIEEIPQVEVVEVPLEEILEDKTSRGDGCLGSSGK